jgi:hypothetical protein
LLDGPYPGLLKKFLNQNKKKKKNTDKAIYKPSYRCQQALRLGKRFGAAERGLCSWLEKCNASTYDLKQKRPRCLKDVALIRKQNVLSLLGGLKHIK